MKKHRATTFTRLLVFLLIFTPIAYLGINYLQGTDPFENLKNEKPVHESKSTQELTIDLQREEIERLKKELDTCKNSIKSSQE